MSKAQDLKTLKSLENLLKESGYQIRKGKGAFNTGYCVLAHKKVVVINRYHAPDVQVESLIALLPELNIDTTTLSASALLVYESYLRG